MTTLRLPSYFISHGGGPWPYMTGEFRSNFAQLEHSLLAMRGELGNAPKAVLMISGHWETPGFTLSSGEHPGMIYDYYGFPPELYHIAYRAPGSAGLAQRARDRLATAGIGAMLDPMRGFDHGTFSIMKPLYPNADIPVVQLSLDQGFDPALHLAAGRALAPLRDEGILIVGSGLSFHNLPAMRTLSGRETSGEFDAWLQQTLVHTRSDARAARLVDWERAPRARDAHPREDHLLPLMVAVGAAWDEPGATTYHQSDFAGGLTVSSFRFGNPPA